MGIQIIRFFKIEFLEKSFNRFLWEYAPDLSLPIVVKAIPLPA